MVLLLLALFFARLGDHAAEREVQRRKHIDRRHARTKSRSTGRTGGTHERKKDPSVLEHRRACKGMMA